MTEADYTRKVHGLISKQAEVWKIADRWRGGIADAHYAGPGGTSLWLEYKWDYTAPPVIDLSNIKKKHALSKLQQGWHVRYHLHGHNVAVVYATTQGAQVYRYPDWTRPIARETFLIKPLTPQELADWIEGQINIL